VDGPGCTEARTRETEDERRRTEEGRRVNDSGVRREGKRRVAMRWRRRAVEERLFGDSEK
jgi:hypothetical protein